MEGIKTSKNHSFEIHILFFRTFYNIIIHRFLPIFYLESTIFPPLRGKRTAENSSPASSILNPRDLKREFQLCTQEYYNRSTTPYYFPAYTNTENGQE